MKRFTIIVSVICMVILVGFTSLSEIAPSDIVIIANIDTDSTTITSSQVQNIFLGQIRGFDNEIVHVAVLKKCELHEAFLMHFVKKTPSQFLNHWKRLVFSGKAQMPPILETEQEMISFVDKNKGAIGYISSSEKNMNTISKDRIKVLRIK